LDPDGRELPSGQKGEIVIRGPAVMKGYYKNSQATAEVLSANGWLRTGDLGYRDNDGYFYIIGRSKEIIIKSGENIAPREIDEALARHPAVMEAAAVAVPDRYLGEDIVAYVVLKPGEHCTEPELLDFCARQVGHFKTPSKIILTEDLPKGPSGKVQRLRLAGEAARTVQSEISTAPTVVKETEGSEPKRDFVEPRNAVERVVAEIWADLLHVERVGAHANFFDLGGHSLLATQVISRVREAFSVELSLRSFFEMPTVSGFATVIQKSQSSGTGSRAAKISRISRQLHRARPQ
jgi:acyl carrier protein